jgi:SAM-dependent methyltransferase
MSGEDWAKPRGDNSSQVEYWNGRAGETWARNQARLDRAFEPLTHELVEKVAPAIGERIIDVGCGCGDLALALASRVGPAGHILGIDVSKLMLERAQARALAGDDTTVTWVEADAAEHEFVAEYDLLASRFGTMFFADPVAAFRNLRRALKPGGRFAFLCWRSLERNPWLAVPLAPLHDLLGPRPPVDPFAPGPFAFSDPNRVGEILSATGYSDFSATLVEASLLLGRAEAAAEMDSKASAIADALELTLRTGPVAAFLRDADEATKIEARRRVSAALSTLVADGEIRLPGSCWLYTGRRPAV